MSTFDYSGLMADAKEIIEEFGQTLTLFHPAGPALNPRTGDPQSSPAAGVPVVGLGVKTNYTQEEMENTKIISGDSKLLFMPNESITTITRIGMNVVINSISWQIVDEKLVEPAELDLLYIFQIRR